MEADLVIKSRRIYDGAGGEPFAGHVGIRGEKLAFVSKGERYTGSAGKVVDVSDLSVAPGFIDTHAHSEFTALADGREEGKALQGVTTEINGNCGLSAAPLYGEAFAHRENDQKEFGITERWSTFREYFSLLEARGVALNFAALAGHGNIRASVMGFSDCDPGSDDMAQMKTLLREAVREGAIGLSTGLIYPPGVYSLTAELVGLAREIKELIYTSHMRSESDELIEAIEETIGIGKESGIAVHISHLKTGGMQNWPKIDEALGLIDAARARGQFVTCDRYPYTAAATDLDAVLPPWTYAGGAEEELRRLKDPVVRTKIRDEIASRHPERAYWEGIVISSIESEKNRWMEGSAVSALADRTGMEPVDFLFAILVEERLRIGAIFHSMNEDNLRRFLRQPYLMIGSDSSVRSTDGPTHRGKPHPRGFGTFPRFIGHYARDLGLMSVAEAIRRITLLPCATFGLKGRGVMKEGFSADVVVFDEEHIIDKATFEEPFLKPEGVHSVLVNGTPVVWEGALTGKVPGRILRHGR